MTCGVTVVHLRLNFYSHSTIPTCLCRTSALKFRLNIRIFVIFVTIGGESEIFSYIFYSFSKFIIQFQFSVSKIRNRLKQLFLHRPGAFVQGAFPPFVREGDCLGHLSGWGANVLGTSAEVDNAVTTHLFCKVLRRSVIFVTILQCGLIIASVACVCLCVCGRVLCVF